MIEFTKPFAKLTVRRENLHSLSQSFYRAIVGWAMPTVSEVGIAHPTLLLQLKDANHDALNFFPNHGDRLHFSG